MRSTVSFTKDKKMSGSEHIEVAGKVSFEIVDGKEKVNGKEVDLREQLKTGELETKDDRDDKTE